MTAYILIVYLFSGANVSGMTYVPTEYPTLEQCIRARDVWKKNGTNRGADCIPSGNNP